MILHLTLAASGSISSALRQTHSINGCWVRALTQYLHLQGSTPGLIHHPGHSFLSQSPWLFNWPSLLHWCNPFDGLSMAYMIASSKLWADSLVMYTKSIFVPHQCFYRSGKQACLTGVFSPPSSARPWHSFRSTNSPSYEPFISLT